MYLTKIWKRPPVQGMRGGYKVVRKIQGEYVGLFTEYVYKQWEMNVTMRDGELIGRDGCTYHKGFHIFPDIRGTVNLLPYADTTDQGDVVVVMVRYRHAIVEGSEYFGNRKAVHVVVADCMWITGEYTEEAWREAIQRVLFSHDGGLYYTY